MFPKSFEFLDSGAIGVVSVWFWLFATKELVDRWPVSADKLDSVAVQVVCGLHSGERGPCGERWLSWKKISAVSTRGDDRETTASSRCS